MTRPSVLLTLFGLALASTVLPAPVTVAAPPSDTIYVTTDRVLREKLDANTSTDPDISRRELLRQALLMVAREQFGLTARDATLREEMPEDPQAPGMFNVKIKTIRGTRTEYEIHHAGELLIEGNHPIRFAHHQQGLLLLVDSMYPWAMKDLPAELEKLGYEKVERPAGDIDDVSIPEDIEVKLLKLDLLSQYAAVRMAHAAIAEEGETLGLLAALARGYANLSQLTEYYPFSMRLAFEARGLLYATRMIQHRPDSPHGYWNRGYLYILTGHSAVGKRYLDEAAKRAGDLAPPAWLPLLELAYNYDRETLGQEAVRQDALGELAAFLWYRSVEFGGNNFLNLTVGKECLSLLPRTTRIMSGMNVAAGVSYGHFTSTMGFSQFGALLHEGLPELMEQDDRIHDALVDIEAPLGSLPGIYAAREALLKSAVDDPSPLPATVLGRLIDEEVVMMIIFRAAFLRHSLGVDASPFLDSLRPFYTGHPHALLIDTARYPRRTDPEILKPILGEFEATEGHVYTVRELLARRIWGNAELKDMPMRDYWDMLLGNTGSRESELALYLSLQPHSDSTYRTYANYMGNYHPESPYRAMLYVLYDWDKTKPKVEWIEKYGRHPAVAGALGKMYASDGEYETAEKWLLRLVEGAPDYQGYLDLAALYWNHLDGEDKAVAIAEEYIQHEDFGLGHSNLSRELTYSLLSRGKGEAALPWAQRAADSGSGHGMKALADCREFLGDLDGALELREAIDERYDGSSAYDFIARTGQGDLQAAWRKKQAFLRTDPRVREFDRMDALALHSLYTGDSKKALERFLKIVERPNTLNMLYTMHAAALAGEGGNEELQQQLWQRVADAPEAEASEEIVANVRRKLARLILALGKDEIPDFEQVDQIEPSTAYLHRAECHYFAGRICQTRGNKEQAVRHYTESAKASFDGQGVINDAWIRLRALDHTPVRFAKYWYGLAKYRFDAE